MKFLRFFPCLVVLLLAGCGVLTGGVHGQSGLADGVVIRSWSTGYPTEITKRIYFNQTKDVVRIGIAQTVDHRLDSVYFRSGISVVSVPREYTSCIQFPDMNSLSFMTDNVTDILGSNTNSKLQLSVYVEGLEKDIPPSLDVEYWFLGKEFNGLSIKQRDREKRFGAAVSGNQVCSWLEDNFPVFKQ